MRNRIWVFLLLLLVVPTLAQDTDEQLTIFSHEDIPFTFMYPSQWELEVVESSNFVDGFSIDIQTDTELRIAVRLSADYETSLQEAIIAPTVRAIEKFVHEEQEIARLLVRFEDNEYVAYIMEYDRRSTIVFSIFGDLETSQTVEDIIFNMLISVEPANTPSDDSNFVMPDDFVLENNAGIFFSIMRPSDWNVTPYTIGDGFYQLFTPDDNLVQVQLSTYGNFEQTVDVFAARADVEITEVNGEQIAIIEVENRMGEVSVVYVKEISRNATIVAFMPDVDRETATRYAPDLLAVIVSAQVN